MSKVTFVILLLFVSVGLLLLALGCALGYDGNHDALQDGGLVTFVAACLVDRLP